jgi:hypothetical protein
MKDRDGRELSDESIQSWFESLRITLQECERVAAEDVAAGGSGRDGTGHAVEALQVFLGRFSGFDHRCRVLDRLTIALHDLHLGKKPRIFQPERVDNRPKGGLIDSQLRGYAGSATAFAMDAGLGAKEAREYVVREFQSAGVTGMPTARGLEEWQSAASSHRNEDPLVAERVQTLRSAMKAKPTLDQAENFCRALAKAAADLRRLAK